MDAETPTARAIRMVMEEGAARERAEIARLLRCVSSIEDMLTRDPPRVGDALWYCEAAKMEKK